LFSLNLLGHPVNLWIDFGEATILISSTGYMDRLVKEATEI
jgi:hypothetical protein